MSASYLNRELHNPSQGLLGQEGCDVGVRRLGKTRRKGPEEEKANCGAKPTREAGRQAIIGLADISIKEPAETASDAIF
jgi:hypothetical protein